MDEMKNNPTRSPHASPPTEAEVKHLIEQIEGVLRPVFASLGDIQYFAETFAPYHQKELTEIEQTFNKVDPDGIHQIGVGLDLLASLGRLKALSLNDATPKTRFYSDDVVSRIVKDARDALGKVDPQCLPLAVINMRSKVDNLPLFKLSVAVFNAVAILPDQKHQAVFDLGDGQRFEMSVGEDSEYSAQPRSWLRDAHGKISLRLYQGSVLVNRLLLQPDHLPQEDGEKERLSYVRIASGTHDTLDDRDQKWLPLPHFDGTSVLDATIPPVHVKTVEAFVKCLVDMTHDVALPAKRIHRPLPLVSPPTLSLSGHKGGGSISNAQEWQAARARVGNFPARSRATA